jgi:mannose-6-phosphate isomerase
MIDAQQDLSIQVHPDDKLSAERHGKMGKNEMWYIVDADHGCQLIAGFKHHLDKKDYAKKISDGSIEEDLGKVDVAPGDCIYIPAGRVHSIGAGMKIAEIQQTSDVTYRLYDFMRKDANGNTRELHTELALDAIDFDDIVEDPKTKYADERNTVVTLVESPFFNTNKLTLTAQYEREFQEDSFHTYMCLDGSCCFIAPDGKGIFLHQGEALIVPAEMKQITIIPDQMAKLLESCVI